MYFQCNVIVIIDYLNLLWWLHYHLFSRKSIKCFYFSKIIKTMDILYFFCPIMINTNCIYLSVCTLCRCNHDCNHNYHTFKFVTVIHIYRIIVILITLPMWSLQPWCECYLLFSPWHSRWLPAVLGWWLHRLHFIGWGIFSTCWHTARF